MTTAPVGAPAPGADQPAPPTRRPLVVSPESKQPPPAAAATPSPPPRCRRHAGGEALAFHAAVAGGDMRSVKAYIARVAGDRKVPAPALASAAEAAEAVAALPMRSPPTSGLAAMLVEPGPPGGGSGGGGALEVLDLRGRTPLHTACAEGRVEMVRVLLRAGADAGAFDSAG